MDLGTVDLGLTVGLLDTWGKDSTATVSFPAYY